MLYDEHIVLSKVCLKVFNVFGLLSGMITSRAPNVPILYGVSE